MTVKDINAFYTRLQRELQGRTRRKMIRVQLEELEHPMRVGAPGWFDRQLEAAQLRRELESLEF